MTILVTLAGAPVPSSVVVADLVIRAGRTDLSDPPTSATCSLALIGPSDAWPARLEAGAELAIDDDDVPLFRGQVSDLGLEWLDGLADLSLIGAGNLARISRRKIGYGAWPEEAWADRVRRVLAEAEWADFVIDTPEPTFREAARAGGETTVSAAFDALASSGGASIVDLPDGSVFVQALESRQVQSGDPEPLELDPSIVRYAPAWSQVLDVVNSVAVAFGPDEDSHTQTSSNPDSIARYGERTTDVAGTLASEDDAGRRGAQLVNRRGYPRWVLPTCELVGRFMPAIGRVVRLTMLPAESPVGAEWQPMLEGYDCSLVGTEWSTTLALSDPVASGVTLPWSDLPAGAALARR